MNKTRFAARKTLQDFHWARYLAPLGPIAIGVLSLFLVMTPGEGPAPMLAAHATSVAAKTVAGPSLAAKPAQGRPAPAPAPAARETEQRPSKF